MILDYFCLFPEQFCYEIVHVRNFEKHVHFVGRCAPVRREIGAAGAAISGV
jgi:hypothetical protein